MEIPELIEELKKIKQKDTDDLEENHIDADNLLLRFINNKEVSRAYNSIKKWYA